MVDIHSHVLWGLDDGAETYEESLALLHMAAAAGTTDIVATPHSNTHHRFLPDQIESRIARLQAAPGPMPRIHRGCDFHLNFANIEEAMAEPGKFSINHRNFLLVEFPEVSIPVGMDEVFSEFLDTSVVPVITHPERNDALMEEFELLTRWVERGCLLQLTALSLLGGFGRTALANAWRLMEERLAHVVASDAHDPVRRHPRLDQARAEVAKRSGEENAERLFEFNPRIIIEGRHPSEIQPLEEPPKKRFWSWR